MYPPTPLVPVVCHCPFFSTRRVYPFTFHFTFSLAHQPSARPSENTPLSLSGPRTFDDSSLSLRTQGPFYTHIYTSATQWLLHFFAAPSVLSSRPWPAAHEVTHPPTLTLFFILFFFYPGVLTYRQDKYTWSRYQDGGMDRMHEPWSPFVLDTRPWRFQEPKHTTFREVDREGTQAYRAVQDTVLLRLTRRIEKIGKPVALDPREAFFTRSVEWCRLTSRTVLWSIGSLDYRTLGLSDTGAIGH